MGNYLNPGNIGFEEIRNSQYVDKSGLIAFYTEGNPKWRISLVRLDFEIKFENGKLKTAENMTPAKRYSYLVLCKL